MYRGLPSCVDVDQSCFASTHKLEGTAPSAGGMLPEHRKTRGSGRKRKVVDVKCYAPAADRANSWSSDQSGYNELYSAIDAHKHLADGESSSSDSDALPTLANSAGQLFGQPDFTLERLHQAPSVWGPTHDLARGLSQHISNLEFDFVWDVDIGYNTQLPGLDGLDDAVESTTPPLCVDAAHDVGLGSVLPHCNTSKHPIASDFASRDWNSSAKQHISQQHCFPLQPDTLESLTAESGPATQCKEARGLCGGAQALLRGNCVSLASDLKGCSEQTVTAHAAAHIQDTPASHTTYSCKSSPPPPKRCPATSVKETNDTAHVSAAANLDLVLAFMGSLFDPVCSGVDHVAILRQMGFCDLRAALFFVQNLTYNLAAAQQAL